MGAGGQGGRRLAGSHGQRQETLVRAVGTPETCVCVGGSYMCVCVRGGANLGFHSLGAIHLVF